MANIIVVPFKEESKAIEALHRIKELDAYGDITLYEHMMIRKKDNKQFEILKNQTDGEGWRLFTGMALGGLAGALVGPLGFVIGLYTGTAVGAVWDASRYDFEAEFLKKVSKKMAVGTIAIVAEVAEDSSVYIDQALNGLSSEIIRSEAGIEFDDYVDEQVENFEDSIEDERQKLRKATAHEKDTIKAKIADLKAKRKAHIVALEAKRKATLNKIKSDTKSRIHKLETRLDGFEQSVSDAYAQARKNRLSKKIKKEEEKLYQLHSALGEDIVD